MPMSREECLRRKRIEAENLVAMGRGGEAVICYRALTEELWNMAFKKKTLKKKTNAR